MLDDLTGRGMAGPEPVIVVDGGRGLEAALAGLWDDRRTDPAPRGA